MGYNHSCGFDLACGALQTQQSARRLIPNYDLIVGCIKIPTMCPSVLTLLNNISL